MTKDLVAVFGGSGFVGSAIARKLLSEGRPVRIVARHPERFQARGEEADKLERVAADLRDGPAIAQALEGAAAAVNAVGLYHPRMGLSFDDIHVAGARRLALSAQQAGVKDLVHLSGIGAEMTSQSDYLQARAEGETVVRAAFPEAVILRPSAIFAPNAGLVTALAGMLRRAPVFPLFGDGDTQLQPVALSDVAAAAAGVLKDPQARGRIYELGGAKVYSYRRLLELILGAMGRRCHLLPVSYGLWEVLARLLSPLPNPPVTLAQIVLMQQDNVVSAGPGSLQDLGIKPTDLEARLTEMVQS